MEEEAPRLSMAEAEAKFPVTQSKEMTEQRAILDSIRDEAEVEANRRLIQQSPTILNREYGTISRRGRRRRRFIRRVDAVLESHSGAGLRGFDITFALDTRHAEHLDRWLKFALDSRASEIAVNLSPVFYKGSAIPITLSESMKPTEATVTLLGYDDTLEHVFTELPMTLSRVETLSLNTCLNTEVVGFSNCLMKFTHLIKLEVTVSILGDSRIRNGILRLVSLLEVAPLLQRLELNVGVWRWACWRIGSGLERSTPGRPGAAILCLQETKIDAWTPQLVHDIGGTQLTECIALPAIGTSDGGGNPLE
ncbi:hypothetical protein D1007_35504 [Hordeum vulgare]|nr:hypothetical protein D1007_35504 [Hordeum vulgare]